MRFTEVAAHFCCAHKSPKSPSWHGHSYKVAARWPAGEDALALQSRLRSVLVRFDHKEMPPEFATGEAIAEAIGKELDGCIRVKVSRDLEGITAIWTITHPTGSPNEE